MKKLLFSLLVLALSLTLCVGIAALDTVYVNDGGTGDGTSAETPFGDLDSAIQTVSEGGKIIITEKLTLAEPYFEPNHGGTITITGGSLVFNHASTSRYYMAGPTNFENITITYGDNNKSKSGLIIASFHPVVMGDGIKSSGIKLYVLGGHQFPMVQGDIEKNVDSSIVIKSGNYDNVIGFSRGSGTTIFRSTSRITIDGGTIKNLYGASIQGSVSGSTEIVINGGTVSAVYTGGDKAQYLSGNAKVTVNGGTISALNVNNVMGHADVYYLGGKIADMSVTIADELINKVEVGTTSLVVRKGMVANQYAELFGSACYEDGTKLSSATDAEVAVFNVLDKKPEKTNATDAKIYVSNSGNGDGLTPETAISDLATAFQMLDGVDGTIVLINDIPLDANAFYEPVHENKIVITSYDGERYFDGGFDFCGKSFNRYFFSGETTIENTRIKFTSSPLFICRWNDIVFGTGLEMVERKIYVVGGYQFPSNENVPIETTGTLTVESGSYYCLIGYSRGSNAENPIDFKGTQTINLLGDAETYRIYGGPAQANTGDNIVINIDGGTVADYIQVGGDQFYCSNNAVINIKDGYVKKLDMHNVLNSTTVNWTGGTIDEMLVSYGQKVTDGNVEIDVAALAGNATYTLNYSDVTPTEDMLKLFDTVGGVVADKTVVTMTIGVMKAFVNGVETVLDAAPVIRSDRTMLPVRFVAESFGATVGWDGATSTATITNNDVSIVITVGKDTAVVNGETVKLDSPAYIDKSNNRTYMPVRFVAEALGATVDWDGATSTATLTK